MSRYSVIFCAFFCVSKIWRLLAQVSRTSIWSLAVRAAWQPGHLLRSCKACPLAADMTVPWTNDKSSQSCTVSLVDGDRQYFCFQATRPEQGDIPFFKVQDQQRQLYRYRFFIRVFGSARLLKLASAISSPRAWVTGRRNRQCGRSSLSSDFDDVCHCEGKCAERGTSSNGCRRSATPALLWRSHSRSTWQRLEDSRDALVVSCGDVQLGDSGRSKETLRALACRRFSSSLPVGAVLSTAHPAVHLEMRRW